MTTLPSSQPGACAEPALMYLDVARALTMFGSEQSFRKILQMALDALSTDIEKVAELLKGGDLQGASHLLHGIKGFAPIFCGDALATQIAEVERSSKADAIDLVRRAYQELMPALTQWRNEIQHYLVGSGNAPRG